MKKFTILATIIVTILTTTVFGCGVELADGGIEPVTLNVLATAIKCKGDSADANAANPCPNVQFCVHHVDNPNNSCIPMDFSTGVATGTFPDLGKIGDYILSFSNLPVGLYVVSQSTNRMTLHRGTNALAVIIDTDSNSGTGGSGGNSGNDAGDAEEEIEADVSIDTVDGSETVTDTGMDVSDATYETSEASGFDSAKADSSDGADAGNAGDSSDGGKDTMEEVGVDASFDAADGSGIGTDTGTDVSNDSNETGGDTSIEASQGDSDANPTSNGPLCVRKLGLPIDLDTPSADMTQWLGYKYINICVTATPTQLATMWVVDFSGPSCVNGADTNCAIKIVGLVVSMKNGFTGYAPDEDRVFKVTVSDNSDSGLPVEVYIDTFNGYFQ